MGIWNGLRSVAGRFINRSSSDSRKPVAELPDPVRRDTITRVLSGFGKFAVDSAVYDPLNLKGGMQVYRVVKEGLKDQSPLEPANLDDKPRHTLMMEEMQARMEKMQEDLHMLRFDDEDSILCAKDLDPRKDEPDESNEKSTPEKTGVNKVFIRSRL